MKKTHVLTSLLSALLLLNLPSPLLADPLSEDNQARCSKDAYNPHSLHHINSLDPRRNYVELEDGSKWGIDPDYAEETLSWRVGDTVVISPNYKMFSSSLYKIKNLYIDNELRTDLLADPTPYGPYSYWIVDIQPESHTIVLQDGSVWDIASSSDSVLTEWKKEDQIIVGMSRTWVSSYNIVLIHARSEGFAYAKERAKN